MKYKNIIRYYEESLSDYLFFYSRGSRAMHYGFWDKGVRTNQRAVTRVNEIVADKLKITKKSRVLDAGCGVGGTALWMAKNIGCTVVGVSLSPSQIAQAQRFAHKDDTADKTTFLVRDYTKTGLPSGSFDAVFGIESICHLGDKHLFMREAYRLLKPGGKLVIADGMILRKKHSAEEKVLLKKWLDRWEVASEWWTPQDHLAALQKAGFSVVEKLDYTKESLPTSRFLYILAILGLPFFWLGYQLGIVSLARYQNAQGCYYQYISRKKGSWGHCMFTAEKPRKKAQR